MTAPLDEKLCLCCDLNYSGCRCTCTDGVPVMGVDQSGYCRTLLTTQDGHLVVDPEIVERLIRIEQKLNELLSYAYGMNKGTDSDETK